MEAVAVGRNTLAVETTMSLPVTATEPMRTFVIHIGAKRVGEVRAWRTGYIAVHRWNEAEATNEFVGGEKTITQAVNRLLMDLGYGKASKVEVDRLTGVKA